MTWSPGSTFVTPGPISTTPAPSWPRMAGSSRVDVLDDVESEWQTPLAAIRIAISPSFGASSSTSSTTSGSLNS